MLSITLLIIAAFFLSGTFFLTAINSAFRHLYTRETKQQLKVLGRRFFYRSFHEACFPKHSYEGLFFAIICAQTLTRFCYVVFVLLFLTASRLFDTLPMEPLAWLSLFGFLVLFLLIGFVVGEFLPRILGCRSPEATLYWCTPLASPFLFLAFPFAFVFLSISQFRSRPFQLDGTHEPTSKQEVLEFIQSAELSPGFDEHEKKLIESVLRFRGRVAREIMVPRVNVFSLPAETSIKGASVYLEEEGYSRIPIYQNTVDNITGVLMYKDLLRIYMEYELSGNDPKILEAPVGSIQKNVLHIPETKTLSSLLLEFRKKQVHLAIVVDEYGGTEGIVTIEDILEEIVGEIEDEYDEEERLYVQRPDGSWIVDARMNLWDAEEELGIKIPQEGEYDTIGGYIFHSAGMIPAKGFIIHDAQFDMEILESNDRSVEKVRIKSVGSSSKQEEVFGAGSA